jgi:excisionase family DNA binding protein
MVMDKLGLSIIEAAEAIGIGRSALYQQIRDGKGPEVIHIGRRAVIPRKALETWFRNLSVQQRAAQR